MFEQFGSVVVEHFDQASTFEQLFRNKGRIVSFFFIFLEMSFFFLSTRIFLEMFIGTVTDSLKVDAQ
jgi:hypothetical protein